MCVHKLLVVVSAISIIIWFVEIFVFFVEQKLINHRRLWRILETPKMLVLRRQVKIYHQFICTLCVCLQIYHFSFKNLPLGTSSFLMLVHHLPPTATPHRQRHHHNNDHHYHHIHPDHLGGTRLMLYLSSPSSFSARHSYFV